MLEHLKEFPNLIECHDKNGSQQTKHVSLHSPEPTAGTSSSDSWAIRPLPNRRPAANKRKPTSDEQTSPKKYTDSVAKGQLVARMHAIKSRQGTSGSRKRAQPEVLFSYNIMCSCFSLPIRIML
jgi:hypothetical protein